MAHKQKRVRYKIDEYPDEVKQLLDDMLLDIRNTYQDIADKLTEKGYPVSRSSIHRYARHTQAAAERIRKASEQTRTLIEAIKDGQDVAASEVGSALLLDGLINRLASAEEEFEDMPLSKAGDLLVKLQRSGVYKQRWKDEKRKLIENLEKDIMRSLKDEVQDDEELLERLKQKVSEAAEREKEKNE